jgi:hypothetical protein
MAETTALSTDDPRAASTPANGRSTTGGTAEAEPAPLSKRLGQLVARNPKLLVLAWILATAVLFLVVPVAYTSWWVGVPYLSAWPSGNWLLWIPAAFGIFLLAFVPIWFLMLALYLLGYVADLSLSVEEESIRAAQNSVEESELEAIRRFENTDGAGLLPLLTYSRAQLDAYYKIGLSQTRRSFFHGIVAMWLGFVLLLSGLALYIVPLDKLGLNPPTQDFKMLLLSGAAIIEFISALFLWMYRSTTAQLTYLYDRQMYSHTAILCFRMSSTIEKEKGDETRAAIVTKLLDWHAKPDRPAIPSGGGLAALLPRKTATRQGE